MTENINLNPQQSERQKTKCRSRILLLYSLLNMQKCLNKINYFMDTL